MDILKILFIIFILYVLFDLFFGHGELHIRLGKKELPILNLKIGNSEDTDKEKGSN
jgi:hypothetical protein